MQATINDVLSNQLKPTKASAKHAVPRSTLKNRLSDGSYMGPSLEQSPILL